MRLESFQIHNFRSINDSGFIDVSQITVLVGRNESGKSNLLLALSSLNPPDDFKELNRVKDFPRHRKLDDCNDLTKAVSSMIFRIVSVTSCATSLSCGVLKIAGRVADFKAARMVLPPS